MMLILLLGCNGVVLSSTADIRVGIVARLAGDFVITWCACSLCTAAMNRHQRFESTERLFLDPECFLSDEWC